MFIVDLKQKSIFFTKNAQKSIIYHKKLIKISLIIFFIRLILNSITIHITNIITKKKKWDAAKAMNILKIIPTTKKKKRFLKISFKKSSIPHFNNNKILK